MANRMTAEQLQDMCQRAKALGFRPERLMLLDERLTQWSNTEWTPSIAVKVLRHGQTAFEAAYGQMGPGMRPDSLATDALFPLASVTKPVVAAAICALQEDGLIDLNDPVRDYIPELTGDEKKQIRIWHLLTHTSGLIDEDLYKNYSQHVEETLGVKRPGDDAPGSAWDEYGNKVREKAGLPAEEQDKDALHRYWMQTVLAMKPSHDPQVVQSYCNTGFQMALDILTRVSGQRPDGFLGEKLFQPLGMCDTGFILPREKYLPRLVKRAEGYMGHDYYNGDVLESESGSGGLKSTVGDMARFGQMMLNGGALDGKRVLSSLSVREMTADHNGKMGAAEYEGQKYDASWGLGWNIKLTKKDDCGFLRGARSYEHGGYGGANLLCDPDTDIVAAYFTVCKDGAYLKKAHFTDMVLSAIDD